MEIGRSIRKNTKIRPTVNEAKFHLPKKFNSLGNLLSTDGYSEKNINVSDENNESKIQLDAKIDDW